MIRVFVVYEQEPDPDRYQEHAGLCEKVPGGVYSEDAEAFVGRFLAAGYAQARSPIKFSERGLEICQEIVRKEREGNLDNLRAAFSALGFEAPNPGVERRG